MCKNLRIVPGPRQNDWAKTRIILAHSSWQSVKNTGNLQSFAAFWARGRVRELWPDLFREVGGGCTGVSAGESHPSYQPQSHYR